MSKENRQANDVASDFTGCCGPEMAEKMSFFFASRRGEGEDAAESCADRMAEMMETCCGPLKRKDEPASEDESAID